MTAEPALPPAVTALLRRALPSTVHIESLLLLARLAPQPASRYAIAAEVRSSPALVAAALADLETAGLAASVPGTEPPEHRFAPASDTVQVATSSIVLFVASGALAALYAVIGLFFLRFRARTGDRLFAMFAGAFFLLAAQRVAITIAREWGEDTTWLYGLRLLAFVLILAAIVDKNRGAARHE